MPRLVVTETMIYEFHELSDKAKQYACEKFSGEIEQYDEHWHDPIIEDAHRVGELLGIEISYDQKRSPRGTYRISTIEFELERYHHIAFHGHLYMRSAAIENIEKYRTNPILQNIAEELTALQILSTLRHGEPVEGWIRRSNHGVEVEVTLAESGDEPIEEVKQGIIEQISCFAGWIQQSLYDERQYRDSSEYAMDYLSNSDFAFDVNGRMIEAPST